MEKLFVIFILCINILFAQQTEFVVGAEHVSAFSRTKGGSQSGGQIHSEFFWDSVKSFGLNYAGLKYFQYYPDFPNQTVGYVKKKIILQDIQRAHNNGINVFLYNCFDHYEGEDRIDPKRWLYQVEDVGNEFDDFNNRETGTNALPPGDGDALLHWSLAPQDPSDFNYWRLIHGVHNYGLVASDLREQNLQPDGPVYHLKIKMRLPDATTFPNIDIIRVRVYPVDHANDYYEGYVKASSLFSDHLWHEVPVLSYRKTPIGPIQGDNLEDTTIVYNYPDSIGTNQIRNYELLEGTTITPYDIRIDWLDTSPNYTAAVDIDYVAVDDGNANKLFTHVWDDRIADAVCQEYINEPGIANFQAHDEVPISSLFPTNYIKKKCKMYWGVIPKDIP